MCMSFALVLEGGYGLVNGLHNNMGDAADANIMIRPDDAAPKHTHAPDKTLSISPQPIVRGDHAQHRGFLL